MADFDDKQNKNLEGGGSGGGNNLSKPGEGRRGRSSKPTVHYLTDVQQADLLPESSSAHGHPPSKLTESRASSVAGTDDEHDEHDDEDYDWSAEEDMEDQEAEFEKRMGVNSAKPKTWGVKRCISFIYIHLFLPYSES